MNAIALRWMCRSCCQSRQRQYRYPDSAEIYCASCAGPMTLKEQEVTVLRLLLRERGGLLGAQVHQGGPAPKAEEEQFLSVKEAATLLGKSEKAIYAQHRRGTLAGFERFGRTLRVRRSALLGSSSEGRVSPGRTRR